MYKTLRLSFSLKNTYRVNSILFALKQIPLIKRILPDALYGVRGLKIFANIISIIWEVIVVFLGKFISSPWSAGLESCIKTSRRIRRSFTSCFF